MAGRQRREMPIEKVQQWIVSALISAVASFPIGALIATSIYKNRDAQRSDALILSVMAGVIGVLAVAAGRLIHRINPLSPYLLLGALPGVATMALVMSR